MTLFRTVVCLVPLIACALAGAADKTGGFTDENGATTAPLSMQDRISSQVLEAQVLLDRALFSPGVIDGLVGTNVEHSLRAFQRANGLNVTGELDRETSAALRSAERKQPGEDGDHFELLQPYMISGRDWNYDFIPKLPKKMAEQARLSALNYTTITEMLAERFHCTPELLEFLNPDATWGEGTAIAVPNVRPTWVRVEMEQLENWVRQKQGESPNGAEMKDDRHETQNKEEDEQFGWKSDDGRITSSGLQVKPRGDLTIVVSKEDTSLNVLDKRGRVVFHAPITAGSEHDPLPIGEWKVNGTERFPKFNYNPDLFWDAEPGDKKAKIPAGPNNPVGVAWIDLSKPHYGLHGTPNPEKIGYTESHGCVRLTNWDVLRLADMAGPDTRVLFVETAEEVGKMVREAGN